MDSLRITQAALDALPEYSCSLPTGTTIGKRWRSAIDYHNSSKGYLIGEYVPHDDPDKVGVKWWQPEISYEPDAIPSLGHHLAYAREYHLFSLRLVVPFGMVGFSVFRSTPIHRSFCVRCCQRGHLKWKLV